MTGIELIRSKRGLMRKIALSLGLTRSAVCQWRQVPAERVVQIEVITGISRHDLRPDLYEAASTSRPSN